MGRVVRFLLPSLKLKQAAEGARTQEEQVHRFLTATFGGYTAASGNLFGYWTDDTGREQYGEHREFTAVLADEGRLDELKRFLAVLARSMAEECIYVEVGGEAVLVYAAREPTNPRPETPQTEPVQG